MLAATINTYYDYGSPFAYFVVDRLEETARRCDAAVSWKPIVLRQLSNFTERWPYSASKRAYVMVDGARSAEFYGIPLQMPQPFPVRSELALRAALVAQVDGFFAAYHGIVFRAAWAEQQDIGEPTVLAACIARAGADPEAVLVRAEAPDTSARLATLTAEAESRGVFGVPTMVVGDELFWGADRLDMLAWRLGQLAAR